MPVAARASRSAVAGATMTRSAVWPSFTCGTSATPVQTSVVTASPDSASHVGAPTKRSASGVGITRTPWPLSLNRRSSSHALYAAMPAPTPRITRAMGHSDAAVARWVWSPRGYYGAIPWRPRDPAGQGPSDRARSALGLLDLQHALARLTQRDRQRLLLHAGLHERPDVLKQALAELRVVGVDLARPLRGPDHQPVPAVNDLEQLVDRRVDDAVRTLGHSHVLPFLTRLGRHLHPVLTHPRRDQPGAAG